MSGLQDTAFGDSSTNDEVGQAALNHIKTSGLLDQYINTEEFLKDLLEASRDALCLLDLSGTVLGWNRAFEERTAVRRKEVLGKRLEKFFSSDPSVGVLGQHLQKGGVPFRLSKKRADVTESDSPLNGTYSPLYDRSGKIIGAWARLEARPWLLSNDSLDGKAGFSQLLFDWSKDGMGVVSEQGLILSVNPAFEQLTGWMGKEWSGRHFIDLVHPEELPFVIKIFDAARCGDTVPLVEARVRCKSGDYRKFEHNITPLFTEGKFSGVLFISREVSDRKAASQPQDQLALEHMARAIAESNEEKYRLLTNAIPHVVWTASADGKVDFVNDQGKRYIQGIPLGRLWPFRHLIHRMDRKVCWAAWREALAKSQARNVECRVRAGVDGAFRWHLVKIVPMQSERSRGAKWLGLCLDIDDQKKAEEALRTNELWFQNMLDTAPVMLWLSDAQASLTFFNRQWLKFTGRPVEKDLGVGWKEIVHPDDLERFLKDYTGHFSKRRKYQAEYRMQRYDRAYRWILMSVVPRHGNDGEFLGYIGSCIDITKQKETEAKLRHSEERYRLVAKSTNDTIWDWDLMTNEVERSDGCRRFWEDDLEVTESRVHYWYQGIHPEDRERVWQSIQEAIEKRTQRWTAEYRHQRLDGSYAHVSDRGHLLYNQSGEPVRMIGAMMDITERKRAEEELQRSEMRYRLAARATSHAIWDWDLDSNRIHWSDAVMTTFQYRVEELGSYAEWWYEHIHPEDRDRVVKGIHQVIDEGGQYWSDEYKFLCGDGSYKNVIDRGFVVHDDQGQPSRMIGAMMDITERMRAEAESRRFKFISDNSNDAHFLVTEDGRILYANNVACERLGFARDELLRRSIGEIDQSIHNRLRTWGRVGDKDRRETLLFESQHIGKHGIVFPVEVSAVLVNFEGQCHLFLVARDITERKRSEYALKLQAEELARSNAELQQFAYVASHDLQEPLRMVNSYLTLLGRKYGEALDEDAHEYIRFAVDGALRMHALINDLLAYSRVGTRGKHAQRVDLNGVVEAALANLRPAIAESGAKIVRAELPTVVADKVQMTQLFQNLLGNAIKFRKDSPPYVVVGAEKENEEWVVSISDNGIGIDAKFAGRIFVIFQRLHTRDEYPGTGIGLAICKKIVERHGGRIWVEPEAKGTTFKFTLKPLS